MKIDVTEGLNTTDLRQLDQHLGSRMLYVQLSQDSGPYDTVDDGSLDDRQVIDRAIGKSHD